jgi:hypothetical protein
MNDEPMINDIWHRLMVVLLAGRVPERNVHVFLVPASKCMHWQEDNVMTIHFVSLPTAETVWANNSELLMHREMHVVVTFCV